MWTHYEVSLLVDRLTAGIPANPKLLQAWLDVNSSRIRPASPAVSAELSTAGIPEAVAAIAADQEAAHERLDPEETHAVVFYRAENGEPVLESRNIKAALKEGANILKTMLGEKNFRAKLAERVFVGPRFLPLTGVIYRAERPISVMTMQGPRTSLKRYEYMLNVPLHFTIRVLDDGVVQASHVQSILEYLESGGLGADRSQGSGTFSLESFRRV